MNEERIKKVFKVFKWISAIASIACAALFVLAGITFIPMIFLKENMTVEAGGLLGFFIDVLRDGATPVTSKDLALLIFPRLAVVLLAFCFLMKANVGFKRGEREGTLFFSGSKQILISLSATSFLLATLPQILTTVAKTTVESPELFSIVETDRTGWLFLAAALLIFALVSPNVKKDDKNSEKTEENV